MTVIKIPMIGGGIAYVPWGPLWRKRGDQDDFSNFQYVIRVLKEVYVKERGLSLRIAPNVIDQTFRSMLESEQFIWTKNNNRTLLLDLSRSLEELRKGLDQKWRNQLNRAERNNLSIDEGSSTMLYRTFLDLQKEMRSRKAFVPGVDYEEFGRIQENLSNSQKMRIAVCKSNGKAISVVVVSALGDTGIYLLGSTGNEGLTLKGSYLLQWRIIQWLKEIGCQWYDLGGIDPDSNPGVYHFKAGLGGKDISFIGQFELTQRPLHSFIIKSVEFVKKRIRENVPQ